MSDNTSDPAGLERDLDRTRSRLDRHLSELQERLSPGQVLDDLMGYFRGSEGAEFSRSLLANVRSNPMPAALTGIGLAWLMASGPRTGTAGPSSATTEETGTPGPHVYGRDDYAATMLRVRQAEQVVVREPSEAEHAYSARLDEVRGQAIGLTRHAQESTESFGQRVREALSAVQAAISNSTQGLRDQVGSAASAASATASSLGASVQGAAKSVAESAKHSVGGALSQGGQASGNVTAALAGNPVLLGAVGLAAGALLGALLPRTEQEEVALGDIAGQVRGIAGDLAKNGLERGKQLARAVVDKGRDSAQAHGLTGDRSAGELVDAALSGQLAGDAKAVAQEVLQTGDRAIHEAIASVGDEPARPAMKPSNLSS